MWLGGGLVLVAVAAAVGSVWWLRRRLLVVSVHGPSMIPTYRDGDRLLVRRRIKQLRAGEVVVADLHPAATETGEWQELHLDQVVTEPAAAAEPPVVPLSRVIKRVAAVAGDRTPADVDPDRPVVPPGSLVLLGDNPSASVDSRTYGYVPVDKVVGAVVRRLR